MRDSRQYIAGILAFSTIYVVRYSFLGGLILAAASVVTMLIRKKS